MYAAMDNAGRKVVKSPPQFIHHAQRQQVQARRSAWSQTSIGLSSLGGKLPLLYPGAGFGNQKLLR